MRPGFRIADFGLQVGGLQKALALSFSVALVVGPQFSAVEKDLERSVDALVDPQVTAHGPGMAVAVVEQGKPVFLKAYGLADIRKTASITPRTSFDLASVTKQFTAMAIMILHDRGRLSFDDDVRKYLPEIPVYDASRPIRIRNLLQHTSGLPEYLAFGKVKGKDRAYLSNNDFLPLFAAKKDRFPLQFPTGQRFQYTNSNYLLLASVVERVSGKSFGAFMHEEVFQPLGMIDTVVFENPKVRRHEPATGYRKRGQQFETEINETLLTVGDGGIWSNLEDMVRWDAGLREGKLLQPSTVAAALQPSTTIDGGTNNYNAGWVLFNDGKDLQVMWHNGAWVGYRTVIARNLSTHRTVIVLGNSSAFDVERTAGEIADLFQSQSAR